MSRSIIFTDYDLDGAGSALIFKWFNPDKEFEVVPLKVSNLREKILSWLSKNSFESYDQIYFFDLDTSAIGDLIDKESVTIYDHHETHVYNYQRANANIVITSSCVKLIYNQFKNQDIAVPKLKLLSLIDDYDSYTLKYEDSYNLNILFWYYNSDRVVKFHERFVDGFNGFTSQEQNLIRIYKKKFERHYNELRLFSADIKIKNKQYKFISCFTDKFVNDVAHKILQNNKDHDIAILINLSNKRVYFRKQKNIEIHLGKLAEKLCDGGGHEYAAGGGLNDTIKSLSKDFQPL